MSGPFIGMRRETGCAGGDAGERPVFPVRSAGVPRAVLGTGGGAVRPRPGVCARGAAGPAAVRAAHGPARGVAPCPVARAPRAGCCLAGGAGCLPPPRVRGGRIEVIVAGRRARRPGRLCRRDLPPPGDAGPMPGCPGLAPSRIRRWRAPCPGRCPRPGPGGMRYLARHPRIARLPAPGAAGRGHDTGAAVTCAFTAMARIWRGCPGHRRSCRHGLAGLALAGCQCLLRAAVSPHRPSGPCPDFFESWRSSWSPVTESNRRPSPYHAYRFRLMLSHQV